MDLTNGVVIDYGATRLGLLPERAVFNMETGDLYIADLHVGKSTSFRTQAIPVPDGDTRADLERLARALERTGATTLFILGDFLHGPASHLDGEWKRWREARPGLTVRVVRGNHDVKAGDPVSDWQVSLVDEPYQSGPLALCHDPAVEASHPLLAGHLHPAVRLRGRGRDSLLLRCFHRTSRALILPAFTGFSGGYPITPAARDSVYAIAEDVVMDVTQLAR